MAMFENKFFKITFSILLVLLILFLWKQVHYIYEPLNSVIAVLLTPLLFSVFFYYLLRPVVRFLTKYLRYKVLAILITFLLLAAVIITVSFFGGSIIQKQIRDLTHLFANYYTSIRNSLRNIDNELLAHYFEKYKLEEKLSAFATRLLTVIQQNFFGIFSKITSIGAVIILIPVIVYYFLKDDQAIYHGALGLFPAKLRKLGGAILDEVDQTLARYISGQLIVALIEGSLALVGYLIIGLPNALILALTITVTAFIPYIGAILGALPAILIGITTSFAQALKVVVVLIVVNQLENNLIAPRLHGSRLKIHPLIVIFFVMAFVTVFGFLGALFAVPFYIVARILYRRIRQYKETQEAG
ncbi:MAG: AI-2E family transporter [Firmicutes bacterium]|nr:AI-2E family transporter [Bacillota bacterium]